MAAYQSNYVVSVIHNNKPLRELNSLGKRVARLPFDSEYKLRIKSKSFSRAMVSVEIDGTDVLSGGKKLILEPYGEIDLERFVDDLSQGKRFKFMSLEKGAATGEIQDPTSPLNGRVLVKIWEEVYSPFRYFSPLKTNGSFGWDLGWGCTNSKADQSFDASQAVYSASAASPSENHVFLSHSNDGATAEGSHSDQKFTESVGFHVAAVPIEIEIWLKGTSSVVQTNSEYKIVFKQSGPVVYRNGEIMAAVKNVELRQDGTAVLKGDTFTITTANFELGVSG